MCSTGFQKTNCVTSWWENHASPHWHGLKINQQVNGGWEDSELGNIHFPIFAHHFSLLSHICELFRGSLKMVILDPIARPSAYEHEKLSQRSRKSPTWTGQSIFLHFTSNNLVRNIILQDLYYLHLYNCICFRVFF